MAEVPQAAHNRNCAREVDQREEHNLGELDVKAAVPRVAQSPEEEGQAVAHSLQLHASLSWSASVRAAAQLEARSLAACLHSMVVVCCW
jgi:predicted phage tail protein